MMNFIVSICKLYYLFKPKFYNKITWVIVITGLGLISPSIVVEIINWLFETNYNFSLLNENDQIIGIILIIVALIYNAISQYINKPTSIELNEEQTQQIVKEVSELASKQDFSEINKTDIVDHANHLFKIFPNVEKIEKLSSEDNTTKLLFTLKTYKEETQTFITIIGASENDVFLTENHFSEQTSNTPILYLIYWKQFRTWTLNDPVIFTKNPMSFQIDCLSSFQNDLSVLFGDMTYLVTPFQLELTYDNNKLDSNHIGHPEHGNLINQLYILPTGQKIELEILDMALIDVSINMSPNEPQKSDNEIHIIESTHNNHFLKHSTLILKLLVLMNQDITESNIQTAHQALLNLLSKISHKSIYIFPIQHSEISDKMIKKMYSGTIQYENYRILAKSHITQ